MVRVAKTARPAAGVSRISKNELEGTPAESELGAEVDGAEEVEDGRDALQADDAVVEVGSSEGYMVDDRKTTGGSVLVSVPFEAFNCTASIREHAVFTTRQDYSDQDSLEG